MRECGRWLHHIHGGSSELVIPLAKRKLQILEHLQEKCLNDDGFQVLFKQYPL